MCVLSASLVIRTVRNKLWMSAARCTWVLLVKTVPLFVVFFSHLLLPTRSPASSSHTRSSTSARHCLLRLEASARMLGGGSQSAGPSDEDHDEAETPFPDFCAGESRCSHWTSSWSCTRRAVCRLVHMLIPGPAVSLLQWTQVCKSRHFLARRAGGVCIRRHLARAAETAEKKGNDFLQRASIARSSLFCCNPAALAWLFRIAGAYVYDTRDIGRMAQWTRGF